MPLICPSTIVSSAKPSGCPGSLPCQVKLRRAAALDLVLSDRHRSVVEEVDAQRGRRNAFASSSTLEVDARPGFWRTTPRSGLRLTLE